MRNEDALMATAVRYSVNVVLTICTIATIMYIYFINASFFGSSVFKVELVILI